MIQVADYSPFGVQFNSQLYSGAKQNYEYQGHESQLDHGLRRIMMGARCLNPTIGRFDGIDNFASAAPGWSSYRFAFNNPVTVTDPTGNFETSIYNSSTETASPVTHDDPIYNGGNLPTVTVSASRTGLYDQSVDRYGYNGSFADYQKRYGFQGVSYANVRNSWFQTNASDFDAYVSSQDRIEADRIALEKLQMFVFGISTAGSMGMGALVPSFVAPRGFSFTSPLVQQPLSQVQINRSAGNAFRDRVADVFRGQGRQVEIEVYKKTPFGRRYIDIEVSSKGTILDGVEAKIGNSPYGVSQRAKDFYLLSVKGYPVNVIRGK